MLEWQIPRIGIARWRRGLVLGAMLVSSVALASNDRAGEVDYWLKQAATEPLVAEAALMAQLDAARQEPPEQNDRFWLQRLLGYQSKATVPGEHGSEDLDAIYPIANAAQGLINRLDRDQVRVQAVALLNDPDRFLDALSAAKLQPRGFHDAAAQADSAQRKALRAAAAQRLGDRAIANLAGELALTEQPDATLLQAAVLTASPVDALHWLRRAEAVLGAQAAMAVYQSAEGRPALRSAAQLHAAGNPHLDSAERDRWLSELSDPRLGASAAAALAKSMNSELAGVLVAKARSSGNPLERKRLLLALKLSTLKHGGAVAQLRADADFLAQLDEETRAWFVK